MKGDRNVEPGSIKIARRLLDPHPHRNSLAATTKSSLDFVGDEENIILRAEFSNALEVALVWDDDARLSLNRLYHESAHCGVLEFFLK